MVLLQERRLKVGWWETSTGAVIGDPPLNVLDAQVPDAKSLDDVPLRVRGLVQAEYRSYWGRDATHEELEALLAFHSAPGGDS